MGGLLGFVDTLQLLGPSEYTVSMELLAYNKYAAMPGMHFVWAILVSIAWASTPYVWARMAAILYQTLMALAVVITGNHYFLDVIAALPVVMVSLYVCQAGLAATRNRPLERRV